MASQEPDTQPICAGCQQSAEMSDLERFVYHDSVGVVFDMRGGAPGKEAFLHPLPGCIRSAAWAGFSRAFETPLEEVDADDLIEMVRDGLRQRLVEQLREARRQSALVFGRRAVEDAAFGDGVELVILDEEAGASVARNTEAIEEGTDAHVFQDVTAGAMTDAFGQKVVVAALPSGPMAEKIGRTLEKLVCMQHDEG